VSRYVHCAARELPLILTEGLRRVEVRRASRGNRRGHQARADDEEQAGCVGDRVGDVNDLGDRVERLEGDQVRRSDSCLRGVR
jgi:hypothetical protein